MKRALCALICLLPLLVGCSMGGSSNSSSAANTTLYGQLQPPAVKATALIGASSRVPAVQAQMENNTDLLADFAEKGTCMVNGKAVSFSLNTGNSAFKVTGIDPYGAYEIRFDLASLSLRATKPYTGSQMNMGTVNLTSTAKSLLYEAYGRGAPRVADIQNYEIRDDKAATIVSKLAELLIDPATTPSVFENALQAELAAFTRIYHLDEISVFTGNDMSGTWTGQGTLCTRLSTGEEAQRAAVNLSLNVVREGDELNGYVDVEVVSTTTVNNGGIIPSTGRRQFTAKVDTEGQFSFQAYRDQNTPIERWSFSLDATDALVCTVQSLHEQGLQSYEKNLPKLRRQ